MSTTTVNANTPTTVSSVTEYPSTGTTLGNGQGPVTLTLTLTEAVTVAGGLPTLTLNDGGIADYTGGSGTDALVFSYTPGVGENTPDLMATAVNLGTATITDAAGNAANLSLTGLTQAGPEIDTTTTSPTTVLTSDWAEYVDGPYWAYNNVWGQGSLVNGVDYTQSITINNSTFPNDTILSWSWPPADNYYAYPEIVYGSTGYQLNPDVQSTQVTNFADLSVNYSTSLSGDTSNYDTIFDMSLTPQPNGGPSDTEYEIEIATHSNWGAWPPSSDLVYTLNDSTLTDTGVYVIPGGTERIIILPPSDMLSGTISISDILKSLVWNGVIPEQEYLGGVQFGAEPQSGSGSVLINSLNYQWNANPTVTLAAGDNTYSVSTPGGNDIVGNGGSDTVVYQGTYSQYEIEQSGAETLIQQNGNISTLDVLNGIAFIQFSDGTYDVATSTFTSNAASPTIAPTITSIVESPSSGDLNAGKVVTVTLDMSEVVTVNTTGGSPTLTLNDGGTATYVSGSGTNALTLQLHGADWSEHSRPDGDGGQPQRRHDYRRRR